jgi:hypothetical protein
MRFISRYGRFRMQARPQIAEAYATGMTKVIQEALYADFTPGGMTLEERTYAIQYWGGKFNGSMQEQDEVTTVEPDYRLGVFDSLAAQQENGWSDEEREFVEDTLLRQQTNDVITIPEAQHVPPWPNYDQYSGTAKALVRKLVDEGHDLVETLAFERQHQNRPEVVALLEETSRGRAAAGGRGRWLTGGAL